MRSSPSRYGAGVLLAFVVALLHWMTWSRLGGHLRPANMAPSIGSMHVVTPTVAPAAVSQERSDANPTGAIQSLQRDKQRGRLQELAAPLDDARLRPAPATVMSDTRSASADAPNEVVTESAPASAASASAQSSPSDAGAPPLLYDVRVADSAQLMFMVERGARRVGTALMTWRRDGDRYDLTLTQRAESASGADALGGAAPQMQQTSTGRVGLHGLQPERMLDSRARRSARAVNLQCDKGIVSFSASTARLPCVPGMQDNLSWWVQLPAIVAALPHEHAASTELSVAVARVHGAIDLWRFEIESPVLLALSDSAPAMTPAIKLTRRLDASTRTSAHVANRAEVTNQVITEAARDTRIDVWLDAAPPHWPLRVQVQEAYGEPLIWTRVTGAFVN